MTASVRSLDLATAQGAIRYDAAMVSDPGPQLFDPALKPLAAQAVTQGGRQAAWFVQGSFGHAVLRHYRRGGLMARLSADKYVWSSAKATRSFAEFDLLHYMFERGLPVPRPLAAAYWRQGISYRAAILVARIPGVRPLARALGDAVQSQVAAAIFAMHRAGVWHADLNAYNILLDEGGKVWLIDFDKGRKEVLSPERRRANLLRLRRSLVKVAGDEGGVWWVALEEAYSRLMRTDGFGSDDHR